MDRQESITATAQLPGEVAGPGVRLTLTVRNNSATAIDLTDVVVDLQNSSGQSATSFTANGSQPFTGSLAAGATSTGVYVFAIPVADRRGVRLLLNTSAATPVVLFTGDLA